MDWLHVCKAILLVQTFTSFCSNLGICGLFSSPFVSYWAHIDWLAPGYLIGAGNPTISWETETQVQAACQPWQPHGTTQDGNNSCWVSPQEIRSLSLTSSSAAWTRKRDPQNILALRTSGAYFGGSWKIAVRSRDSSPKEHTCKSHRFWHPEDKQYFEKSSGRLGWQWWW